MQADRALDEYAARQYGVFSRQQAEKAGFSSGMISNRVQSGAWLRLAPAVYALASAPPKWERQMAAALMIRPGSIVAGRSAAYLHGFPGYGITRPVILAGLDTNARLPIADVIRSHRFEEVGRVRRSGFEVTDEAETIMSLARDSSNERLETLVDWALARRTCTVSELFRVVAANDGVPGVGILRPIVQHRLPDAYQPPTTELERLLYRLMDDPQLPPYTRQMPMRYQQVNATVDAYVPSWRLIVEGDGRRWHNRKADMARDRLRDNEATAHGFAVLRFTYEMLRDGPRQCLDTLLRTGRVRTQQSIGL